ncbi:MAG: hypothetical protein WDN49_04910 [Acetobacteraceae bacterium]
MVSTMKRAAAMGVSANRITLLRDTDGDGVAEIQEVFMEGLNQPFGMALLGDKFYVGNTDGVVVFPYVAGANQITAPGQKLTAFKPGGHWTRSLLPSPDGLKLYAGVGSLSNIGDNGMEAEEGRAAIHELDLATGTSRIFASACAMPWAWPGSRRRARSGRSSTSATAWATRRRRDYLTSVRDGGFYGWPYCYWGADGGRPGAAGRRPSHRRLRRITRWAAIPHRWAFAGCPPARCPASRTAWRSGSTGPGTAAS